MTERTGPLWIALQAAAEVIDINRDEIMTGRAFNADVSPALRAAESIIEQCAQIAEESSDPAEAAAKIRELAK